MSVDDLVRLTSQALTLCLVLSLPAVAVSAIVGLVVSFFQAITSLQDSSVSQGIKLLAVTLTVFLAGPWAGATLLHFSDSILTAMFQ
jgi:type III secretion protein S